MVRKIIAATVSAALCTAPVGAAFAQATHYDAVRAPLGATASLNLRVPLGAPKKSEAPSYGLTLGYGQTVGMDADGFRQTREVKMADLRFNMDGELRNANVMSFDLANLDNDRRLNLTNGSTTLLVVAVVLFGAGIYFLVDNDDDEPEAAD